MNGKDKVCYTLTWKIFAAFSASSDKRYTESLKPLVFPWVLGLFISWTVYSSSDISFINVLRWFLQNLILLILLCIALGFPFTGLGISSKVGGLRRFLSGLKRQAHGHHRSASTRGNDLRAAHRSAGRSKQTRYITSPRSDHPSKHFCSPSSLWITKTDLFRDFVVRVRPRALRRELHVPEQHPQQPAGRRAVDAGRLGPRLEQVRGAP